MKLIKMVLALACEDIDTHILKTYSRECWLAEGTGLACAPYGLECIPTLLSCSQWILTHVASGYTIGSAFPADKHYAQIYLQELARERLDFTQDRWAIAAQKETIAHQLGAAIKRTAARWSQIERERKRQEREVLAQQLSLFGEHVLLCPSCGRQVEHVQQCAQCHKGVCTHCKHLDHLAGNYVSCTNPSCVEAIDLMNRHRLEMMQSRARRS